MRIGLSATTGRHFGVVGLVLVAILALGGCQPSGSTPGLSLHGNPVDTYPAHWEFSNAFKEIHLEVQTPYWLAHSVTIWCAEINGALYIGARDPESKFWPEWVESKPDIRLKIGPNIYSATTAAITDDALVAAIRAAYAVKYDLPSNPPADAPEIRYWAVLPRAAD